ncbi:MAG: hypothetical protein RIC16_09600 [Rhodospirillales bacterium]
MTGPVVILQSHRETGLPPWIGRCLDSVREWCAEHGHDYRFVGDEMLDLVPSAWRSATGRYPQIAADLGRLYLLRDALDTGAGTAFWLDADVVVLDRAQFDPLIAGSHAFGREIWIESVSGGGFRARKNVHNAAIMMRPGNPVLAFYTHAAERIVERLATDGGGDRVPPQIIGPKLLGGLHNIVGFPLIESVGMLSPPVLADIAAGSDGAALNCFRAHLEVPVRAVNLSASLIDDDAVADAALSRLLDDPERLCPHRRPQ